MSIAGKKILIIEDDEHIARVYAIKLGKEGVTLFTARDGEDGLGKIQSEIPDIVLLDLMLPIKDGFWVLEEKAKLSASIKKIPVIVLSNLGQAEDINHARSLGAVDYIIKAGTSIQAVVDLVKEHLKKAE